MPFALSAPHYGKTSEQTSNPILADTAQTKSLARPYSRQLGQDSAVETFPGVARFDQSSCRICPLNQFLLRRLLQAIEHGNVVLHVGSAELLNFPHVVVTGLWGAAYWKAPGHRFKYGRGICIRDSHRDEKIDLGGQSGHEIGVKEIKSPCFSGVGKFFVCR